MTNVGWLLLLRFSALLFILTGTSTCAWTYHHRHVWPAWFVTFGLGSMVTVYGLGMMHLLCHVPVE